MNRPALFATLSLALAALNTHGTEAAAPAASAPPHAATATSAAPAPAATARATRRVTLPVGAETLPPAWLEAVEPGLSKHAHAPRPAASKRLAGAASR